MVARFAHWGPESQFNHMHSSKWKPKIHYLSLPSFLTQTLKFAEWANLSQAQAPLNHNPNVNVDFEMWRGSPKPHHKLLDI